MFDPERFVEGVAIVSYALAVAIPLGLALIWAISRSDDDSDGLDIP